MASTIPKFNHGETVRVSRNALTAIPHSDGLGRECTIDGEAWEIYEPVDEPVGAGYWYTVIFPDCSTDYLSEDDLERVK